MKRREFLAIAASAALAAQNSKGKAVELPAEVVEDKIRGGFLGQILGDLNGLKHEMKYILEPGNVQEYTPGLPNGGWTDDDTDIEWPYVLEMLRSDTLILPYERIADVWTKHINRRIWCSHLYLRQLLDLGILPPLTGRIELNPWADFNLSGQFVAESWGLISPGMPQTAARMGAHYAHVSVDGEPVQATQMIAAMVASAFLTDDMDRILDAGAAALDAESVMRQVVSDVRKWSRGNRHDWRATRRLTEEKYCKFGGDDMRDRNGVWLNGGSTIAALEYGAGDWVQTVRHAFNFGWDADNNAAAAGTILGVVKGYRALRTQGWNIKDSYRNTSRDGMPNDETITSYAGRLVALADRNLSAHGGARWSAGGKSFYRIVTEPPANVERLPDPKKQYAEMRSQLKPELERGIAAMAEDRQKARAAYLAICLDFASDLARTHPQEWRGAVQALSGWPRVMQVMFFESPLPVGEVIRRKAIAAGLPQPAGRVKLWE